MDNDGHKVCIELDCDVRGCAWGWIGAGSGSRGAEIGANQTRTGCGNGVKSAAHGVRKWGKIGGAQGAARRLHRAKSSYQMARRGGSRGTKSDAARRRITTVHGARKQGKNGRRGAAGEGSRGAKTGEQRAQEGRGSRGGEGGGEGADIGLHERRALRGIGGRHRAVRGVARPGNYRKTNAKLYHIAIIWYICS